jgi:hypothetical protein
MMLTAQFYDNEDFMLKNATYKQKLAMVSPLMPLLIDLIKKDLKNDHLRNDRKFCTEYFPGKHIPKLTTIELVDGYMRALEADANAEAIGDFIAQRWIVKNPEIYNHFEEALLQITSDFTALSEIELPAAQKIASHAVAQFGPIDSYLFTVLNAVVFPEALLEELKQQALTAQSAQAGSSKAAPETAAEQRQDLRLTEKYEKKLAELEKKYHRDITALKKQVASLQRKLQEHNN